MERQVKRAIESTISIDDPERRDPGLREPPPIITSLEREILSALLGREMYGLELCHRVQSSRKQQRFFRIGALYPSLHRLERNELISSTMKQKGLKERGGNRRKYYRLTGKGMSALKQVEEQKKHDEDLSPVFA